MKARLSVAVFPVALLGLALLASCSAFRSPAQSATQTAAARPTSTFPPELASQKLHLVDPPACLQAQFSTISTESPQGDLLAWSPVADVLALDVPDNRRWGWFVGNILIYDVPGKKELFATESNDVYGDLTWSPGADYLAFVKFSAEARLYTVLTLRMRDHALVDYFPGTSAQSDDFSSQKGIDSWSQAQSLVVTSSCGSDCARFFNINVTTAQVTVQSDKRKLDDTSLLLQNQLTSPDGTMKVVTDDHDMSWMASTGAGSTYFLTQDPIDEIKWSFDSQYFAIRLADQVSVYKASCP